MKSRIKSIEECTKLLQIEIPQEFVKRTCDEVYEEIRKFAKVPGFRQGSAPRDLLEKHHSKYAGEEVLKRLIPEGYNKALEEHGISPFGSPRLSNINFEMNKATLTFEAEINVRPVIKLKNYKALKVKKRKLSVSKEEVDETIARLKEMHAKYNDVARPLQKGDYAVCDVEAFVEGKSVTKKNKNMWILADKEASLLGMGEELVGLAKGEIKEIDAKLPETYPDKKYAGKPAKFVLVVNEVKEKELPAVDDTFAKNLRSENVDALKKDIESQLFRRKEDALKIDMENQLMHELLKDNKFSPPSRIVETEKALLRNRLRSELVAKGIKEDEAEKRLLEIDKKLAEDAAAKVRIYFILDEIAAKENIEVTTKDIDEKVKSIAESAGRPFEEVKTYYEKENLIGGIGEEIKEAKVLELLLKQAEVIEEIEGGKQ